MELLGKNKGKRPSSGTIYPSLNALEKRGLIQSRDKLGLTVNKKVYDLTHKNS